MGSDRLAREVPGTLVILGGARRGGLCRRLYQCVLAELEAGGSPYRVHDLLDDGFDPVLRLSDSEAYARACDPEQEPLVARYQRDVQWADVFVVVHPVWWFAPPALLKGWIDRVFVDGVALRQCPGSAPEGLLTGKRMLVVQTFNTNRTLDRLVFRGVAGFFWKRVVGASVGIEKVTRLALYGVESLDEGRLARFEARLRRSLAALVKRDVLA